MYSPFNTQEKIVIFISKLDIPFSSSTNPSRVISREDNFSVVINS